MKTRVLLTDGKGKEIELPAIFSSAVREDICQKYFEARKKAQPYSPFFMAGKQHSASGKIRHSRRAWKTSYGHGMSRVPRKIFWRRGTQFYWVGAEISSTRGGRRAHPPRIEQFLKEKKINKKERKMALQSALSATTSLQWVAKRYSSVDEKQLKELELPVIVSSDILKLKTREFFGFLKKIVGKLYSLAIQHKEIRAGKGKARGRVYKKNAGLLFVIGNSENFKIKGIDTRKVNELVINDLWPLGRLTIYSENAIKEIEERCK